MCWYIIFLITTEEEVDTRDKICLIMSHACLSLDFHAIPCFILHILANHEDPHYASFSPITSEFFLCLRISISYLRILPRRFDLDLSFKIYVKSFACTISELGKYVAMPT